MKKQILLILSLILFLTTFSFAQTTRTVTNSDLEKFRQKREQADAEYRATYKQRGLPSPEELEQREVVRQKELAEYAARAREIQRQEDEIQSRQPQRVVIQTPYYSNGQASYYYTQEPFYYGGQIYYNGGRRYRGNRRVYYNVQPHTQLSPLLPNVQINTTPTRIFTTPTRPLQRIYPSPVRRGGRIN